MIEALRSPKTRVGAALGAVALGALFAGPLPFTLLVLLLAFAAAGELFRMQRARGVRAVPAVGLAGIVALFVVGHMRGDRAPEVFPVVIAAVVGAVFVALLARRDRRGLVEALGATLMVVLYVGLLGAFVIVLRRAPDGFRTVLVFALMTVLHDAASYFVGSVLGRRRLAPTISPDKTWEGWAGGTVAAFLVAVAAAFGFGRPFTVSAALGLAAVVSAVAPLGDLAESALKRDLGAKDSGAILPGHGGVLDRIDSVLMAAPAFHYAFVALTT